MRTEFNATAEPGARVEINERWSYRLSRAQRWDRFSSRKELGVFRFDPGRRSSRQAPGAKRWREFPQGFGDERTELSRSQWRLATLSGSRTLRCSWKLARSHTCSGRMPTQYRVQKD